MGKSHKKHVLYLSLMLWLKRLLTKFPLRNVHGWAPS